MSHSNIENEATKEGSVDLSVIIPARNEESELEATLEAVGQARARICPRVSEVMVVDNLSTDETASIAQGHKDVRYLRCERLKAPCARNYGAARARGRILVFIDADTRIPAQGLEHILELATRYQVGIFGIRGQGKGRRSRCWWLFWNAVRHLPLAHAKALPAFMFCTRAAFQTYGPFDESVVIGEEWPLTAACYRQDRERFIYDESLYATTLNRRMEKQRFGYTLTFLKYVWAVLHRSGRLRYSDWIR